MIKQAQDFMRTRTGKLALTYLGIIMAMTLIFSGVIFAIASHQFDRPLPDHIELRGSMGGMQPEAMRAIFDQRALDAKWELFVGLLFLNVAMLLFGAWFSYYLAHLTMEPIERAMHEQSRFVTDASHELRTPLTALRSINEVALRRKKMTDAEAKELAAKNVAEVTKLHTLATSLLGLVHTEQTTVQLVPLALQHVISEAMEPVVIAAQEKHVEVIDEVPSTTVLSERDKLVQVVRILLDNAVKYSHKNGTVRLYTTQTAQECILHVQDNGVGISKDDVENIFARFYRADESRNKEQRGGFGLGLSIAKTISDQLGMNIAAISELKQGSIFSISLPLAKDKEK